MFGDTAIMVHPDDERYQKYIGKEVYIPGTNRKIPVIIDEYVDKEFGTGVVKVTPAHDPNDFEVGNRHNLARLICMNEDGTMNELAGEYNGMDRFECRKELVKKLQDLGLCHSIEKMIHSVGHSERTGVIVEPRLSKQWFVKMDKLSSDVLEMQKNKDTAINFVPDRFNKTFETWISNTQDWCISRQLWWGHRIPAWYKDDDIIISQTKPEEGYVQDEDVLDTWFSSALWAFSTFGWPEETELLKRYTPTDCLVTGYDIIFFWVARMAFMTKHFRNKRPFNDCLIHGLIRDEQGRKMSKSLGNGIDPFDVVDQYGCDSLRYFLTTNSTPGQDLRYSNEKVAASWNFINKIWNISRFIQINLDAAGYNDEPIDFKKLTPIDKWLFTRLNDVIEQFNENFEKYEFGEAARVIYNFAWDDFASWYVELSKVTLNNEALKINTCAILKEVIITIVKILHPYMPFVTEEIYQHFMEGSVMVSNWPTKFEIGEFDTSLVDSLLEVITSIRNLRQSNNVSMSKPLTIYVSNIDEKQFAFLKESEGYLKKFINHDSLSKMDSIDAKDNKVIILNNLTLGVPAKELINIDDEKERLNKELLRLQNEVDRSNKMLNNPNFISKAPQDKIQNEKDKLLKYEQQLKEVERLISDLEKLYD